MGAGRPTVTSVLPISGDHYEIPKLEYQLDAGSNLAFSGILSRNITIEEYQKHQLQHKCIPRDIEFFDENDTPVSYQIQHKDNPNDTCNDFYPIKYKRGNDKKYYGYKTTEKTLPSIVYLINFQLSPFNRLLTVSDWEDPSTSLDEYVAQRPNQTCPLTHPTLIIVRSTPLARPSMTQQIRRATMMTHITSVQTLKITVLYAISVGLTN